MNEHANGWYNPLSYFVSKIIVEVIPQVFMCSLFATIFYWYTSQPDGQNMVALVGCTGRFRSFLKVFHITAFTAMAMGFFLGAIFVNSVNAIIVISTILLLSLSFFSGFFKRIQEMNNFEEGLSQLSFMRWALELAIITIYGEHRCQEPEYAQAVLSFGLKLEDKPHKWWMFLANLFGWWLLALFAMIWQVLSVKVWNCKLFCCCNFTFSQINVVKSIIARYVCNLNSFKCILVFFMCVCAAFTVVQAILIVV